MDDDGYSGWLSKGGGGGGGNDRADGLLNDPAVTSGCW